MGLTAVVYKSVESLPPELWNLVRIGDPTTGELVFFSPDLTGRFGYDFLEATSVFLGNIEMISWLREEVNARWSSEAAVISANILYSGSHTGDVLAEEQVELLSQELQHLYCDSESLPSELHKFLSDVRFLISVSKKEQNPIVFV